MFKFWQLDEEALEAAAEAACVIFFNSQSPLGWVGFITEEEHAAAEAYLVGAWYEFFVAACNIDPNVTLTNRQGREAVRVLVRKFLSEQPLFYTKFHKFNITPPQVEDRVIAILKLNPGTDADAYQLGVDQANMEISYINDEGPKPDYTALLGLIRSRKNC